MDAFERGRPWRQSTPAPAGASDRRRVSRRQPLYRIHQECLLIQGDEDEESRKPRFGSGHHGASLAILALPWALAACGRRCVDQGGAGARVSPVPSASSADGPPPVHGWAVGDSGVSGARVRPRDAGWRACIGLPRSGGRSGAQRRVVRGPGSRLAAGYFRTILATRDGGEHWKPQHARLAPHAQIAAVCFLNERRGWAVGNVIGSTFVIDTRDGGRTWHVREAPGRGYAFDVSFVDEKRGWLVGAAGASATNDGGRHWRRQRSGFETREGFLNGVQFVDRQHGWVVGGDGGEWERAPRPTTAGRTGIAGIAEPARCCWGCRSSTRTTAVSWGTVCSWRLCAMADGGVSGATATATTPSAGPSLSTRRLHGSRGMRSHPCHHGRRSPLVQAEVGYQGWSGRYLLRC